MTISNVGYDGEVSDIEFAQLAQHIGAVVPVVAGRTDFAVTVNTGATLTCNVAVGSAAAPGVLTTSDAVASVSFSSVATTGQSRWDAVVLRRNWSTGTTTLVVVQGTAAANAPMVLPSGVDLVLNAAVDQVLALVQITNGQSLPTAVADRRLQASKVFTAQAVAALPTASSALYGMEAVTPEGRYRCGSAGWSLVGRPIVTTTGFAVAGSGFVALTTRYSINGAEIQYDFSLRRSGASLPAGAAGDMSDTLVITASGIRPDQSVPVTFSGRGGATETSAGSATFFGYMNTSGGVYVSNGMPNTWLTTQATGASLNACIKFTKES